MIRKKRTNKQEYARKDQSPWHLFNGRLSNPPIDTENGLQQFEAAAVYYAILKKSNALKNENGMCNCFAVRLARQILDLIKGNEFPLTRTNCFKNPFYLRCLKEIDFSDLGAGVPDRELLLIYIKQIVAIIKTAGLVGNDRGIARLSRDVESDTTLFYLLFNAFWNEIDWSDIFPSNRDAAKELKECRGILTDIMLRHQGNASVEAVANEFFELTAFSRKNDLFMISFLDFYFFTWLRHFGMIQYHEETRTTPVTISATDTGRKFLTTLQKQ